MPEIDRQSTAAARYFQLVREFSARTKSWQPAIRYQTRPDERFDLTLVASRVYGSREEFLTIQAAAGFDSPEYEMTERLLVLPTPDQMKALKDRAGFINQARRRG